MNNLNEQIEVIKKANEYKKSHLSLIKYCLNHGYKISVHLQNEIEPELKKSDNFEKIKEFSECADITELCLFKHGKKLGWVLLVLDNEDEEIVSDFTNSNFLNNWWNKYQKITETL
jgi:negative regulator of genetic competence, sporulation and motility|tara:strand:- start:166 stop:513 length:348 start_codon:yes stop_codon:yes gene_type:complete